MKHGQKGRQGRPDVRVALAGAPQGSDRRGRRRLDAKHDWQVAGVEKKHRIGMPSEPVIQLRMSRHHPVYETDDREI
jgi:hypothetical protein